MIAPPRATKPPKIERISVRDWLGGYESNRDDARVGNDGLTAAQNVLLDQDGVIRPWPSLVPYGPAPTGTVLGEVGEFKEVDGLTDTNWLITVQNVSGTAKVYIRKDTDAWIECDGKTYNTSAPCHFAQIDDKVLVLNGVDNLSYLDIPTQTVIPFVSLSTVTGVTATETGLTGTTYTLSYKVTASNQGETAGSTASVETVDKLRGSWNGTSEYVTITFDRVTNADRYHIYLADVAGGTEYLLATVADPGTGSTVTYVDDGQIDVDPTRPVPLADTSAGPKATRATVINGQVFLTGDPDNPRYVRYGGTGEDALNFSPYEGGGWSEVGNGGKEVPVKVASFRTGQGVPAISVLCQSTGGRGKRYIMEPATLTVGSTTINYFAVKEDNGADGTDAPDGVLNYADALWYPSLEGFKTTFTKQQVQNILSTEEVSDKIERDVSNISLQNLDKCVGVSHMGRLYWALPVGSTTNNQIWTLDLKRGRGWMLPRNIAADWLMVYGSNDGDARLIVLSDNKLYELSYASLTNDEGTAFPTYARSGIIKFSEDGQEFAKVIDVTFVLLRPRGNIQLSVAGLTEDEETETTIGTEQFSQTLAVAGWGEASWVEFDGWGYSEEIPDSSGITRKEKPIEIDEELQWLVWEISSDDAGVDYALSDVIIRYVPIGTKDKTD